MSRIDFSNYILPVPSVDEFGLVDPDDENGKHPVFISLDRTQDRWGARVMYNKECRDYKFIPVDNNIPLKRDDGSDAPRCDCILETEKSVCFIELKNQRKGYLSKARDQIISTLGFFDNLTLFDKKTCIHLQQCCHMLKFHKDHHEREFFHEYGIMLDVTTTVKELD